MVNETYCHIGLLTPEQRRYTQKVTSVDSELDGHVSLHHGLAKMQCECRLVGAAVFSAPREPCTARRVCCVLGDTARETEIFAFSVRIRAHYSL